VVRYNCEDANEHLRQRVFEKAVDATATSPFGRCPKGWLLLGLGSGGRVAALVSSRCRPPVAGMALVDYPLKVRC
jgi:predicted alpha/beta-hydrolase family hydrolase